MRAHGIQVHKYKNPSSTGPVRLWRPAYLFPNVQKVSVPNRSKLSQTVPNRPKPSQIVPNHPKINSLYWLGRFGTVWDSLGRFGTVWDICLGRFGTVWDGLGHLFGTVWDSLGRFGTFVPNRPKRPKPSQTVPLSRPSARKLALGRDGLGRFGT